MILLIIICFIDYLYVTWCLHLLVRSVESHGHGQVFGVRPGKRFAGGRAGHALVALTPFRDGSREETSAQEVAAPGSTCTTHTHADNRHSLKTRIDKVYNNNTIHFIK